MKTIIFAAMIGVWATAGLAHSPLNGTTPADEAVVVEVPAEVTLDFKGLIRLTRVTATHAGGESVVMDLGVQKAFANVFALPLEDEGQGDYVIDWRGLGDDGHALKGSFSFVVGE